MVDFDFYEGDKQKIDSMNAVNSMLRSQKWFEPCAVLEDVYYKDGAIEFSISARSIWPQAVYDHDDEVLKKFEELSFGRLMTYSNVIKYYIEAAIEVFNKHDIGVTIGKGVARRVRAIEAQYFESLEKPSALRDHMLCY